MKTYNSITFTIRESILLTVFVSHFISLRHYGSSYPHDLMVSVHRYYKSKTPLAQYFLTVVGARTVATLISHKQNNILDA